MIHIMCDVVTVCMCILTVCVFSFKLAFNYHKFEIENTVL